MSVTIVLVPVDLDGGMTMIVLVNVDALPGSSDDRTVRSLVAGFMDEVTFSVAVVSIDAAGFTAADLTCARNKG